MATKSTTTPPKEFTQTLQEFCSALSTTDRRVEMIGAFHSVERAAGRMRDTATNYQKRFTAFLTQPA